MMNIMPKKLTQEEFIKRAKEIHGDKYDYSKVEYINNRTKVCIICPEHGEFWVRPNDVLHKNVGCRKCNGNYRYANISDFSETFYKFYPMKRKLFTIKKDNVYINNKTKICVTCHVKDNNNKEHGEFWIRPNDLISGFGCPICGNNLKLTTEQFIEKAKKIHGDKYDYSKVEYIGAHKKVCIVCSEHGEFWQEPANHTNGSTCPYCNCGKKSKMIKVIIELLNENNIKYTLEKTFDWLKYKKNLFLDFYLPEYNIAIEYNGEQHYQSIEKFGGIEDFKLRQLRDKIKLQLCEEHNIKLFYLRGKNININSILDYINETAYTKKNK